MLENASILIVNNIEANRAALSHNLCNAGYIVHSAESIQKGLSLLSREKIDLILLEVQLPDGDGFEMCVQLKSSAAFSSVPVLMISQLFMHSSDKVKGLESGADACLVSPVDSMELIATVKSLLRGRDTERKLRDACEKAESANKAKTEFLANMSHEIRTPMNAIIGLASILVNTPLSDKQMEFITTLQQSADSLLSLINDMLDISKIEDNHMELECVPFNLREMIQDVMGMMSVKANEKHLALELHYLTETENMFIGDPLRLKQVIINLVNNAVKFTSRGSVTVMIVSQPAQQPRMRDVTIQIMDTGIGVPQEKLAIIFDKFTQADSSTSRKYGGTGLGLTISKRLIEKMKGRILVESQLDIGSTFTIQVPLRAVELTAAEAKAGESAGIS